MHLGTHTWGSGTKHGATTAETRRYIDFAAANGFRGVLVEGWNKGWDGDWFARGDEFSFTEPYPDFDLVGLAAYAKKKGVHLVGHHETAGNIAVYERQLGAALDLYQKLGIDSVKTGYVADAGGIQAHGRGWPHSFRMARRPGAGAPSPARGHRGGQAPHRGESARAHQGHRSAPHLSELGGARRRARHGIQRLGRSAESARARGKPGFHAHAGWADGFHAGRAESHRCQWQAHSVDHRQAAGLVRGALQPHPDGGGSAGELREVSEAFQFIKDVPTDWSETRVLNGEVGDYVTIARKDRNSQDWYLGAITDEAAAHAATSSSISSTRAAATTRLSTATARMPALRAIRLPSRSKPAVSRGDTLTLKLAPGGGQAIRFSRTQDASARSRTRVSASARPASAACDRR